MNIGHAADASRVSAKKIRYYEQIGLMPPADRSPGGYRDYRPHDLDRLRFIRNARDLGFPIERVRLLLDLWNNRTRSNAEVKALAFEHILDLEQRARQLKEVAGALRGLAESCKGDGRPDCPIIGGLEGGMKTGGKLASTPFSRRKIRGAKR